MTLEHVDTAIAFAMIMLGASLLVTILTQAASTLLNLRGNNLTRSLRDLLQTLYPEQGKQAEAITRAILQHPLLSDSSFGSNDPLDKNEGYRLPVAIGAAAIAGVAIGLWVGAPEWAVGIGVLAAVIVGLVFYYLSKDWELASAVRVEEFFDMLEKIGKSEPDSPAGQAMNAISRKIRQRDELHSRATELEALALRCRTGLSEIADKLRREAEDEAVAGVLDLLLARIGTSEDRQALAAKLRSMVRAQLQPAADQLIAFASAELTVEADQTSLAVKMREAAESGLKEIEILFNAAMDRASQRFALHSRFATVVFSVAFAFLVHLDAIELFERLSSDAELRAKLVASSDAMMKQADKILAGSTSPAPSAAPASTPSAPASSTTVAPDAVPAPAGSAPAASPAAPAPGVGSPRETTPLPAAVAAKTDACLRDEGLRARVPDIYGAALLCPHALTPLETLRAAATAPNAPASAKDAWLAEKKKLGPFATRQDAYDYLEEWLATAPGREQELARYRENLNALLQSSEVNQLFDHAASVNGQLARAGIRLWPDPYPGLWPTRKELPGLLVSAALLSLGAPFWFNLLKTLSNLRPLVATREERDRLEKAKAKPAPR
jgi:hypothetical protein